MFRLHLLALSALLVLLLAPSLPAAAQAPGPSKGAKNVVLVHGAFADGSSWAKVIPLLQAKGFNVIAVQNPLTSLADDVAATKRALALVSGPVLLVGHSWAGMVITEAGNDPKVSGLVYISGLVPDDGQSVGDVLQGQPAMPGNAEFRVDAAGFQSLTMKGMLEDFAQDLPVAERKLIFATQGPWAKSALSEKVTTAAWKTKPSWVIVDTEDRMISPELERAQAKRMKATTLELKASHVSIVSQPAKVAAFIIAAAEKLPAQ